jgi:hypothetical protein
LKLPKPDSWLEFIFRDLFILFSLVLLIVWSATSIANGLISYPFMVAAVPIALSGFKLVKGYRANKIYDYMKIYSIAVSGLDDDALEKKEFSGSVSEQLNSLNPVKSYSRRESVRIDTVDRNDRSYIIREPDEQAFPPDWEDGFRVYGAVHNFPANELREWRKLKRQERSLNRFVRSTTASSLLFLFIWIVALGSGSRVSINANLLILFTLAATFSLTIFLFYRKRSKAVSEFRRIRDEKLAEETKRKDELQRAKEIRNLAYEEMIRKNTEQRKRHEEELNRRLEQRRIDELLSDLD